MKFPRKHGARRNPNGLCRDRAASDPTGPRAPFRAPRIVRHIVGGFRQRVVDAERQALSEALLQLQLQRVYCELEQVQPTPAMLNCGFGRKKLSGQSRRGQADPLGAPVQRIGEEADVVVLDVGVGARRDRSAAQLPKLPVDSPMFGLPLAMPGSGAPR